MQKLCIFVSMTAFSYLGWRLGLLVGELMTAFLVSGAFSLIGVYAGWKAYHRFFA